MAVKGKLHHAFKHGKSHNIKNKNVLYNRYNSFMQSCYNKNSNSYKNNGGRGITVCKEWKNNFLNFSNWAIISGFTNSRVLHRIDRDKNFSPDNCKWINKSTKNKLTHPGITNIKRIYQYNGELYSMSELSKLLNIPYSSLRYSITTAKFDSSKIHKVIIK